MNHTMFYLMYWVREKNILIMKDVGLGRKKAKDEREGRENLV